MKGCIGLLVIIWAVAMMLSLPAIAFCLIFQRDPGGMAETAIGVFVLMYWLIDAGVALYNKAMKKQSRLWKAGI